MTVYISASTVRSALQLKEDNNVGDDWVYVPYGDSYTRHTIFSKILNAKHILREEQLLGYYSITELEMLLKTYL